MTAQPDHATDAADYLAHGRTDAAQVHALLAIHEQLVAIARRLPSRPERVPMSDIRRWPDAGDAYSPDGLVPEPEVAIRGGRLTTSVADELRAQVTNMHRPSPDCGKGFVECIQTLEANRIDPSDSGRYASGWNSAMDMIRDSLIAHGYTASPDEEGDQ